MTPEPIHLAGLLLTRLVMNGAGPVKYPEDVRTVAQSESAAVVVGSITVEPRQGNHGITYFHERHGDFSLNSKGLPNPGLDYYRKALPEMVKLSHDYGKPLIVSAAGFSPDEYALLSDVIMESGADGQELNLGCPNVWGADGKQKRIASFDEDLTGEVMRKVRASIGSDQWTAVKLSPFSDPTALEKISTTLNESPAVKAVTSTNTFPNAFYLDEGKPAIDPAGGLGGLSGTAMRPIGLGQIKQLKALLNPDIALIGVGGISTGADVADYLAAGAAATQVTTAYINEGPSIFEHLLG